jgi:3-dehydroquinate dehydratase-2
MEEICIINGPNLNLLGKRQPEIYGSLSFDKFFDQLEKIFPDNKIHFFQSNSEGSIIDRIHEFGFSENTGLVLNAAGYSHTSVAIADAVAAVNSPVVEVHISNVFAREDFRHKSLIAPNCVATLSGMGLYGYQAAINFLLQRS